jgi:hypothetical protein
MWFVQAAGEQHAPDLLQIPTLPCRQSGSQHPTPYARPQARTPQAELPLIPTSSSQATTVMDTPPFTASIPEAHTHAKISGPPSKRAPLESLATNNLLASPPSDATWATSACLPMNIMNPPVVAMPRQQRGGTLIMCSVTATRISPSAHVFGIGRLSCRLHSTSPRLLEVRSPPSPLTNLHVASLYESPPSPVQF